MVQHLCLCEHSPYGAFGKRTVGKFRTQYPPGAGIKECGFSVFKNTDECIGKSTLTLAMRGAIQEVASDYVHIAGCSRHRIQLEKQLPMLDFA